MQSQRNLTLVVLTGSVNNLLNLLNETSRKSRPILPVSTPNHRSVEYHPLCTQIETPSTRIRTEEEENTAGMRGLACFLFTICDTSSAVQGRDLRPSAVVLGLWVGTRQQNHRFDNEKGWYPSLLRNHTASQPAPSRLIQPPHSNPCPMGTLNTLRELDFDRMLPDGGCPTVRRSTASPSLVKPKRSHVGSPAACISTGNCALRSCVLRHPYTRPPPLDDGACSAVHHSTAN